MTPIKIKDKIYKKLLKSKTSEQKERLYRMNSKDTETGSTFLLEIRKQITTKIFLQEHKQNMLKTWEGIKLININNTKNKQFLQQVFHNNCQKNRI